MTTPAERGGEADLDPALAARARIVRVFPLSADGGNPAPTILDADDLDGATMQRVAAHFGHESGFVLRPTAGSDAGIRLRFFVPRHEMEMCGHATVGALWLLRAEGRIGAGPVAVDTLSGRVRADVPAEGAIAVSQPAGTVAPLDAEAATAVRDALGLGAAALGPHPLLNARTSRAKTLVPLRDRATLDAMTPDWDRVAAVCAQLDSTGLYPVAPGAAPGLVHARQFPKGAGYPEDAATGVAAAALAYGLRHWGALADGASLKVRQGEAMGRASEIGVRFDGAGPEAGCWISGVCAIDAP